MQLGPLIRKVAGGEGMNLIVSSGASAGQDVYQLHIHLIPRREGTRMKRGVVWSHPSLRQDAPARLAESWG